MTEKAVLVVSFGTTHLDTLEKTIQAIEWDIAGRMPGRVQRRAFTSGMILRRLADREGLHIDDVPQALERLAGDGFADVVLQPTHIMNGEEFDKLMAQALEVRPKLIVAGASAYPRAIDFAKFREIADACGAKLMVDMAHIAGLVAAGLHQNPVPYADVVTTTTHKTLRGPRGGLILCKEEYAKAIDKAIFPGTQGGPLMHIIAAKAVCLGEALQPAFKEYGQQVVNNAQALAKGLLDRGVKLVSGGTDNHLMLIDLTDSELTGKELERRLDEVYITANKNTVPGEKRSPFTTSGVRLGTPAVTTRGLKEADMDEIAACIALCMEDGFEGNIEAIRARVEAICQRYPLYA